ncbi:MAG: MFS transporter [Chloroflexia bacterium]|nr:MFS transporter [Chloroflexia bacterium]
MTKSQSGFSLLLFVAFLAFISIGLPDAVLGVAWPSIQNTFDRPRADLGFILFASGAGYFSSGILAGKAIDRLGVGRLLAVSTAAVSAGLLGYALSPAFWFLMVVAALIGFGSGAVDAGLNFYASEHFSVTVMNWLHAFFGIGAMIGPFIMAGVLAAGESWRLGYVIVAIASFLMAVTFVVTERRWTDGQHHSETARPDSAAVSHVLRQPLVWLQLVLFFFMTGIEAGAGAWSYTMLFEKFDLDAGEAGLWAGFYWGAIALGRLVLSPLSRSLKPARLIQFGTFGLFAGALMMTRDQAWLFQSGLLVFGFAMAPLFPTLMSLTPSRLGSHVSLHAIGFQVSAAVLGGATIPTLAGILAGRTTLTAIPWTLAVGAVIVIALETVLRGRDVHDESAPETKLPGVA